jgi:hypothetical protein
MGQQRLLPPLAMHKQCSLIELHAVVLGSLSAKPKYILLRRFGVRSVRPGNGTFHP